MADKTELLLALYLEDIAYARHHEDLRSTITNLILVIGAALAGFVGFDNKINNSDIPAAIFLIIVGLVGAIFSYKHYERFHSHYARAREFRSSLDSIGELNIGKMKAQADKKHRKQFPRAHRLSAGWLWTALPVAVSVLGLLVLIPAMRN